MGKTVGSYVIAEEIGSGGFGVVKRCKHKKTNVEYAAKIIDKKAIKDESVWKIEIDILKRMNHPGIVNLVDVIDEKSKIYIIMELMKGGELFDRIVERGNYTEQDSMKVVKELLEAVEYLHSMDCAHRDLKPENVLFVEKTEDSKIKLADFGLSKVHTSNDMLRTEVGTTTYMAPEIINRVPYSNACDLWSVGVITFIVLSGYPPFWDESENDINVCRKILKGAYDFNDPVWDVVSEDAKDLIRKMLVVDFKKRISAKDALQHPWFTGKTEKTTSLTSSSQRLSDFNKRRKKFRNAIQAAMMVSRMKVSDNTSKVAEEDKSQTL